MVVCRYGYVVIVKMLLKMNVDVNFFDCVGIFFIVVCRYGYLIVVELLIKVGVDVDKFS